MEIVPLLSCTRNAQARSGGRGMRGSSPLEFLEVKKHYNRAKNQINVQQSVLNADSKKAFIISKPLTGFDDF